MAKRKRWQQIEQKKEAKKERESMQINYSTKKEANVIVVAFCFDKEQKLPSHVSLERTTVGMWHVGVEVESIPLSLSPVFSIFLSHTLCLTRPVCDCQLV